MTQCSGDGRYGVKTFAFTLIAVWFSVIFRIVRLCNYFVSLCTRHLYWAHGNDTSCLYTVGQKLRRLYLP